MGARSSVSCREGAQPPLRTAGATAIPQQPYLQITSPTKRRLQLLGSKQGKQNHVADGFGAGKQHREPVDPDPETASRRHTVFQSEQEFLVDVLLLFACLFEQTLTLHKRVIQLAVTWRDLRAVNDQFKNVDERAVFQILFGQWYELFRTMRHKQRINSFIFDEFL